MSKIIEDEDEFVIELDDVEDDENLDGDEGVITPPDNNEDEGDAGDLADVDEESIKADEKTDKEFADLSEEEKKFYGQRAQKRIRQLIKQSKELEEKLVAAQKEREVAAAKEEEFSVKNLMQRELLLNNQEKTLKAQAERALFELRKAKEENDIDAEVKAQDALAAIRAEAIVLQQVKSRFESEKEVDKQTKQKEVKVEIPQEDAQPIDRKALEWNKRNIWFGGDTSEEKLMTRMALAIHNDLIDEGVDPRVDPEDYYTELDTRVRKEFPDYFKDKQVKKRTKQVVVNGGARTDRKGKRTVKLNQREIDFAKRLGITPEAFAREKLKREASSN